MTIDPDDFDWVAAAAQMAEEDEDSEPPTPEDILEGIARIAAEAYGDLPVIVGYDESSVGIEFDRRAIHWDLVPDPGFWMDPMKGMDTVACGIAHQAQEMSQRLMLWAMYLNALSIQHAIDHHGFDPFDGGYPDDDDDDEPDPELV